MIVEPTPNEQIQARFKLVCRKCASENVVMDVDPAQYYSDLTGWQQGSITIGCNDCKQNDLVLET